MIVNAEAFNQSNEIKYQFFDGKAIISFSVFELLCLCKATAHPLRALKHGFLFDVLWQVLITTSALIDCYLTWVKGQKRLSWAWLTQTSLFHSCLKINVLTRGYKNPAVSLRQKASNKTFNLLSSTYILFAGLFKVWGISPDYGEGC